MATADGFGDYWTSENRADPWAPFTVLGIRIDPSGDLDRYEEASLEAGWALIEAGIDPIEQHLSMLMRSARRFEDDWCERLIQWLYSNDEEEEV